jgi:dihydrolipoamide dehydrogenase
MWLPFAAQQGFNAACVDAFKNPEGKPSLGGTCLNVVASRPRLLQSSENFHAVQHDFAKHGITVSGAKMDVAAMLERKTGIISQERRRYQLPVQEEQGCQHPRSGRSQGPSGRQWLIEVTDNGAVVDTLEATNVIIATGSSPRQLPGLATDNHMVLDNEGAWR